MKVEVKNKVSDINYPCLMIAIDTQMIVLFNKEKCGLVLLKGNSVFEVGYYNESFTMSLFKLYYQEITLKND